MQLDPKVIVTRGRYRKRVFVQLTEGILLEVNLPIDEDKAKQAHYREARDIAEWVALGLKAVQHVPTEFLHLGVPFHDDDHNEFLFPRVQLVEFCERLLWRFKITTCKPPGWEKHHTAIRKARTKLGRWIQEKPRNKKGQYVTPPPWRRRD